MDRFSVCGIFPIIPRRLILCKSFLGFAFLAELPYNDGECYHREAKMLAIAYFCLFELCGTGMLFLLLPRVRIVARVWLGLCLGLILMMWLPAVCWSCR